MASKFSAELESIMMDRLEVSPDEHINVRIFLEKDSIIEKVTIELESNGLVIADIEEGPDVIIKGNIEIKNLTEIEAIKEVERIEYDRSI